MNDRQATRTFRGHVSNRQQTRLYSASHRDISAFQYRALHLPSSCPRTPVRQPSGRHLGRPSSLHAILPHTPCDPPTCTYHVQFFGCVRRIPRNYRRLVESQFQTRHARRSPIVRQTRTPHAFGSSPHHSAFRLSTCLSTLNLRWFTRNQVAVDLYELALSARLAVLPVALVARPA